MLEVRNAYDGQPARPWVLVQLAGRRGRRIRVKAVVDTGSPFCLVTSQSIFERCRLGTGPPAITNFGVLEAAWVDISVPGLQFTNRLLTYGSDDVARAVKRSSRDFSALIGLPLLRMFEYGGDATDFWLRSTETHEVKP